MEYLSFSLSLFSLSLFFLSPPFSLSLSLSLFSPVCDSIEYIMQLILIQNLKKCKKMQHNNWHVLKEKSTQVLFLPRCKALDCPCALKLSNEGAKTFQRIA